MLGIITITGMRNYRALTSSSAVVAQSSYKALAKLCDLEYYGPNTDIYKTGPTPYLISDLLTSDLSYPYYIPQTSDLRPPTYD